MAYSTIQWISVKEKFPSDELEIVLVAWTIAHIADGGLPMSVSNTDYLHAHPCAFDYWMPIPPLPKPLARGGIVKNPEPAIIGEPGYVLPISSLEGKE